MWPKPVGVVGQLHSWVMCVSSVSPVVVLADGISVGVALIDYEANDLMITIIRLK